MYKILEQNETDVCVVGGGMVGAAVALGLARMDLSVVIVEGNMPQPYESEQTPDIRMSAFSMASVSMLEKLGAWQYVQRMRLTPYSKLSVWEKSDCVTRFDAADINASHLGFFVENRLVQLGLHQALASKSNVTWITDKKLKKLHNNHQPELVFDDGSSLGCKLLIGADGAQSNVRALANIGTTGWRYSQQALGIKIKTKQPSQDITWQQFTPSGPLAFLPMYDGHACLIWYHNTDSINQLKSLSSDKLKQQIKQHFPPELVDFDILETASFPLTRMHANRYVAGNTILMGDAAHTINPLAGQGVNLGFKDVAAFLKLTEASLNQGRPFYQGQNLADYERQRRGQNLLMMSAMDVLYATFSNEIGPIKAIRNLGLKMADKTGVLKHQVMKYAMGLE